METIIVAVITGGLSLLGVILSNASSNKRIEVNLEKQQAVTNTKLEALTDEVKEHNNFAKRMPVVEEKLNNLEQRVTKIEGR